MKTTAQLGFTLVILLFTAFILWITLNTLQLIMQVFVIGMCAVFLIAVWWPRRAGARSGSGSDTGMGYTPYAYDNTWSNSDRDDRGGDGRGDDGGRTSDGDGSSSGDGGGDGGGGGGE
jgi:uncharacterized membrane protein YgcG